MHLIVEGEIDCLRQSEGVTASREEWHDDRGVCITLHSVRDLADSWWSSKQINNIPSLYAPFFVYRLVDNLNLLL
jgi:hypothetical protein